MANKVIQNFTFRLDNKNSANWYFLLFILSGVLFTGGAFFLISRESAVPLIIEVLVAILYFIGLSKIKPTYFECLVFSDHFTISYYSVASISRDYQSFEVSFREFSHFILKPRFYGLRKELIISVLTPYGVADYPPVSLSILSKKEREQLMHVLKQLAPQPESRTETQESNKG